MKRCSSCFLWFILLFSSMVMSCDDIQSLVGNDENICKITVLSSGNGNVSVSNYIGTSVNVIMGNCVTIVATPDDGYGFDGWYIAGSDIPVSKETAFTFIVSESITLTAKFVKYQSIILRPTVIISSLGNGSVKFEDSDETAQSVVPGEEVTVIATPDDGYDFVGWFFYDFNTPLSTEEVYTFTVGNVDIHLFAKFEKSETSGEADSYSKLKEKEREAIMSYIRAHNINIISFDQFIANDSTTDVNNNEYVLVDDVYVQILNNPVVKEPTAYTINDGDNIDLLVRYYEYNILENDTITANLYAANPDEMRVANNGGSYIAAFTSGLMFSVYGSSVPNGWLVPLRFLTFTRKQSNLAKVNIIVPHTKGTSNATTYVYPCLYQISYQPSVSVMIPE